MYFAEAKGAYWQVIEHRAPELAIPGLEKRTAHRQCHPACEYDRVIVDFLPSDGMAWLIAEEMNRLGADKVLRQLSQRSGLVL